MSAPRRPEQLARDELLRLAYESMLLGMIVNRAILPQVVMQRDGGFDAMNDVAIDLWMGASPVYTHRMRRAMGIEGDDVAAIMKALQLDVGFVHQYMDVAYRVDDAYHGEFWLDHCGALLDAEPAGEERVFGMCHTIEDPTFDATAYATNPRARIRPIHRPPRVPADRHPHCHWTIVIDPANEPVGPATLTRAVAALPLARVSNERAPEPEPDGRTDSSGPFDPGFTLPQLSRGALLAVMEEFRVQSHLLVSSAELALAARFGADAAREMLASHWTGVAWITSERVAAALGIDGGGPAAVAEVLALTPDLPPGFTREIEADGPRVRCTLTAAEPGLLDPDHPGSPGLLARGERGGVAALVQAVDPRARVDTLDVDADRWSVDVVVDPDAEAAAEPGEAAFLRLSLATTWSFEPGRAAAR